MTAIRQVGPIFETGPFPHFQKTLGLFRPVGSVVLLRATMTALIGWLPLLVLVVGENLRTPSQISSFFTDFGVHARSLIAAPLLIICELNCLRRLEQIAHNFVGAGLVEAADISRVRAYGESTRMWINSTVCEVIAILLAFAIAIALRQEVNTSYLRPWYLQNGVGQEISLAGNWYAFVSLPLLLILFFGWLWRILLWAIHLAKVSRLRLKLIAAHPDRVSGLMFLNSELIAFMPLGFTFGVVVAGSVANKVSHGGRSLTEVRKPVLGLLIVVLILFVGPLLVFVWKLQRQKISAIFRYGALAEELGQQFEAKWMTPSSKVDMSSLEVPDFSATTDLYGIVANVYEMRTVPVEVKAIVGLIVATLLPFIPVLFMLVKMSQIVDEILQFLF